MLLPVCPTTAGGRASATKLIRVVAHVGFPALSCALENRTRGSNSEQPEENPAQGWNHAVAHPCQNGFVTPDEPCDQGNRADNRNRDGVLQPRRQSAQVN